ncbi:MAG: hypothetical protein HQL47_08035 [Gammaproteobacteria bacterium]|nr:hypothetical protein [Gammaproteobacteria bacterium]
MRGRIDRRGCLMQQGIDQLMQQLRALARSPAALPVAFVSGILVERLRLPGINCSYGLLAGQAKLIQLVSSLMGSPAR